jgi:hypothetical protein
VPAGDGAVAEARVDGVSEVNVAGEEDGHGGQARLEVVAAELKGNRVRFLYYSYI